MRRPMRVLLALFLLLGIPALVSAQDARSSVFDSETNGFTLDQNYPNPFNPETTIPFQLGDDVFVDGRGAVVSIRIFNVLAQLVAHPVALRHASGEGVPVDQLEYTQPGRYEAYWDGTDQMGRQVASGIYLMQLSVNGMKPITRKMYVMK